MTKVHGLRLGDEDAAWLEQHAEASGVDRAAVLKDAFAEYRLRREAGEPSPREVLAEALRVQSSARAVARESTLEALQGIGDCPERPGELGHIWKAPQEDPLRSCRFCGLHGREPAGDGPNQGGGFFAEATAQRAELFSALEAPMESGTGKPEKVAKR